jgi:hypothetical protein
MNSPDVKHDLCHDVTFPIRKSDVDKLVQDINHEINQDQVNKVAASLTKLKPDWLKRG